MSEPRRPTGSPQGTSPGAADDDELAIISPERLRETARISLVPGVSPPIVSPPVQDPAPALPPSLERVVQEIASKAGVAARAPSDWPVPDLDLDGPTMVIPSAFDDDSKPKLARGRVDDDAQPTQIKQTPFFPPNDVATRPSDPGEPAVRKSGVATQSPSPSVESPAKARDPKPKLPIGAASNARAQSGQSTRRATLLGVGALKIPNLESPASVRIESPSPTKPTPAASSSPVSSPLASKISALAPPLGQPSPTSPMPRAEATKDPARPLESLAGAASPTAAETVRPGRSASSQVPSPQMVSPRMPPPLDPTPSRPPQRTARETIPSQRELTAQPPLALPELMPRRSASRGPSPLTLALAVFVPLAVGVGAGLLFFKKPGTEGPPKAPAVAAVQAPSPADSVAASPRPSEAPGVAARAEPASIAVKRPELAGVESGDGDAIAQLAAKSPSERSLPETLSLARGRIVAKQRDVEGFRERYRKNPDVLSDPAELVRLRAFIDDRDTALLTLSTLAETPTPAGADVLYDVWVGTRGRSETTWLAEQLVLSADVRGAASKSLQVTLALRTTEQCDAILALLPEAREHADARSMRSLRKLLVKRGCGPNGREDCFACLRSLDREKGAVTLAGVIAAARGRRPPRTR